MQISIIFLKNFYSKCNTNFYMFRFKTISEGKDPFAYFYFEDAES